MSLQICGSCGTTWRYSDHLLSCPNCAKLAENRRKVSRYDEAKALIDELRGALLALHAIVEEECAGTLADAPHTDKRARKAVAMACDFLATESEARAS